MRKSFLAFIILTVLCSCQKNSSSDSDSSKIKKLSIKDINLNGSSERIFITLQLVEDFAITEARFSQDFEENMKMINAQKKYKNNDDWLRAKKVHKMDYMIKLIINEILYQEALINEEVKVHPLEVERKRSAEQALIIKKTNMSLKEYLLSANISLEDFETQIRKKIYRDKAVELQNKYLEPSTPTDIKEYYEFLAKSGSLNRHIRTTYLIERDNNEELGADMLTKSITNLNDFQNTAEKISTHESKANKGFFMEVPYARPYSMQTDESLLINQLFTEIWKCEPQVPTVVVKKDKTYILWVDSEEKLVQPLNENIQNWIVGKLLAMKRAKIEEEYALKSSDRFSFSARIGNDLVHIDLKHFLKVSGQYLEEEIGKIFQEIPLEE